MDGDKKIGSMRMSDKKIGPMRMVMSMRGENGPSVHPMASPGIHFVLVVLIYS